MPAARVLPKKIFLELEFLPDERARLEYQETFAEEDRQAFEASFEWVKAIFKDAVMDENTIRLVLEDRRENVGNFLVGEFLQISSLGEVKIRDFVASSFVAGTTIHKEKS